MPVATGQHFYQEWGTNTSGSVPLYGASGTIGVSGTNPILIPYPTGIVAGQFLVCHVFSNGNADTFTTPAGWAQIPGPTYPIVVGTTLSLYGYYRIADGTESGNLSITWTAIAKAYGDIHRFSGCDSIEGGVSQTATATTTMTDADIITSGANRLCCNLTTIGQVNQNIPVFTGMAGGQWVEKYEIDDGTGTSSGSYQLQTASKAVAGTVGGGSCTVTICNWGIIGFALYQSSPSVNYPYIGGGYYPN
jgi:hypothetical protein